ncbi:MAG TPA: ABC transporter substrate-binding protein [Solirubrobacteraceae bacterium]
MKVTRHWAGAATALVAAALLAAGCGSSNSSSTSSTTATAAAGSSTTPDTSSALGSPKPASGSPITIGLINLETGPVTFPEYRQAAEDAVKYVNQYKGGIGGHPIKLATCASDGTPPTSARCASQLADKHPALILGGADTGGPGSFTVWKRTDLAVIGGIPFTPVESNAPNAAQFISVSVGDNAAASTYAVQKLGVKKAAVIYTDDTQGKFTGLGVIANVLKKLGVDVKTVPVAPNASDFSAVAASAIQSSPDMVYVNSPNACPGILKALKAVGNQAKIFGIDPCTSPPAIKAAGDAAEGLYFAQPFDSLDSGTPDAKLMLAVVQKYGPKDLALDSIAQAGFGSVMNIQAALNDVKTIDTKSVLAAIKNDKANANFLAHDYTCDGKQLPGSTAVCNAYQKMKQVKGGKVTTVDDQWISGASLYRPTAP